MKTISLTSALALVLALASMGLGAPLTERQDNDDSSTASGFCRNPIVRREWRSLTVWERLEYIKAVKCLQRKQAKTTALIPGAVTRFDDFQGTHIYLTDFIHYVGQFLPWHRYFVWLYEKSLREECGYTGGQPYWDWTLDYQNWAGSPVWNPITGFGGNGPFVNCTAPSATCIPGGTGGGCVPNGPFKDYTIHLGPVDNIQRNDHCLTRDFYPSFPATYFNPTAMNYTMSQPVFESFRQELEGLHNSLEHVGQHGAGHAGTGGQMIDLFASPGDPVFYLHHGNLDKLWWDWQKKDLVHRLYQISGPTLLPPTPSPNVTLEYVLDMTILAPSLKIKDVMDIRGQLCYKYE